MRLGARRVRVRSSDLEQFIAESSSARTPDETNARKTFEAALAEVQAAGSDDELAPALRRLCRASLTLARVASHD
jgi:hypothetical protein